MLLRERYSKRNCVTIERYARTFDTKTAQQWCNSAIPILKIGTGSNGFGILEWASLILDEILSVQQEKSGVQMHQSCTINISRATAIACSAQYMCQGVQSRGEDIFFWKQNNKSQEILPILPQHMTFFFWDSVFSCMTHYARPIEGVHESCFCFAVVQSSGRAKGLKM